MAFECILTFVQNEVVGKQRSVLVSDLLGLYKEEYISIGGDGADIQTYTVQNLTRKVNEQVTIKLLDKRKGRGCPGSPS